MADNVLGSISITITGDTSQLNAALASAVQGAQASGAKISSAMNDGAAGADRLTVAIGLLAGTIERESAAASLAIQRNIAMQQSMAGAAQGARQLGESSNQATYGIRYMIFGLKDIGEGRYRFALAELVNVVLRLGPAAIAAGAALAVVGGAVYAFTELKNQIQDSKDASEAAFGSILRGAQKSNDELDVSIEKLKNEIAVLEHKPVNRAAEAIAEIRVQADNSTDSLLKMLDALKEATKKQPGDWKGPLTNQASVKPIEDLEKNARRQIEGLEKGRQSELTDAKSPEEAKKINEKWDSIVNQRIEIFKKLSSAEVRKQTTPSAEQSIAQKMLQRFFPTDTSELEKADSALRTGLTAEQDKVFKDQTKLAEDKNKQAREDAKKGVEEARALATARVQAQQKALEEGSALEKRFSDSAIEVSHAAIQAQIANMTNRQDAAVATAEEELRVAKAHQAQITDNLANNTSKRIALIRQEGAAEGQGKSGTERATIGVKTGERIAGVENEALKEESAAGAAVAGEQYAVSAAKAAASRERDFETLRAIGRNLDRDEELQERAANLAQDLAEIKAEGSGQEAELKAEHDKLSAEQKYSLEVAHTYQQTIDYLTKIAAIEERARQDKISGLQGKLGIAQAGAVDPNLSGSEQDAQAKKAATLQIQIADLQQQSANANYAAQTKILETIQSQNQALQAQKTILDALTNWSQISVGTAANQFAQTLVALPQQIGDSLARSIFTAPKKGQDKAQEIGKGLVQTTEKAGENLAGKLIGDAIEKLISQLVGQAAIDALTNSVTATNTTALGLLTAAVTLNTTAQATAAGGGAASGIGSAAGGAASAAGAAGSAASSALTGMLAPIIGGAISGALSIVGSLISAHEISQHIDQTTAAVNLLRTSGFAQGAQNSQLTASSGSSSQASTPSSGPSLGGALSGIGSFLGLNSFTTSGVPVDIVRISAFATLGAGLLGSLLHFDRGGSVNQDMLAQVHAGEWVLNADQVSGRAPLPPQFIQNAAKSIGPNLVTNNNNTGTTGDSHFHIYGMNDPLQHRAR